MLIVNDYVSLFIFSFMCFFNFIFFFFQFIADENQETRGKKLAYVPLNKGIYPYKNTGIFFLNISL